MKATQYLATVTAIWCLVGSAAALEGRTNDMKPSREWVLVQTSQEPIFTAFPNKPTEMRFALPLEKIAQNGLLKVLCTEEAGHTFFVCTLQCEEGTFSLSAEQLQKTFKQTLVPYLFYHAAGWGEELDVQMTSCCSRPALAFRGSLKGEWMRGLTFLENGQVQQIFFLIAPSEQWDDLAANAFLQSVQRVEQ